MKKFFREPLVHFLLIGAGLFLLFSWRGGPASIPAGQAGAQSTKIVIAQGDIDQLAAIFEKTWQRKPTEEEMKGLVEGLIRDEIYYREAVAIGLDRDDAVLKRRLRQKMEFIFEDISSQVEPKDEELQAFMRKNQDRYLVDPQVAFHHVYINANKRKKDAEAYAVQVLAELTKGADPNAAGDPFLLGSDQRLSPLWDIKCQYGEVFSNSLLGLKQGKWEGPVKSGYGLHLVFIDKRVGGRLPDLKEVREAVKRDWAAERQRELKDAAYAKIRERYVVEIKKPKSLSSASVAEVGNQVVNQ